MKQSKNLNNLSQEELIKVYMESVKDIDDADFIYWELLKTDEEIFNEFFKPMLIEALEKNAYIYCEYDNTPLVMDSIKYYLLIDKKTGEIIKKIPV